MNDTAQIQNALAEPLTQERLKELLHYDPITGEFIRISSEKRNDLTGSRAGGINGKGYETIRVDRNRYLSHRLAWLYMNGRFPEKDIDHINHSRSDNRFSNLRIATKKINGRNQSKHCTNTSGHTGVYWKKSSAKWCARITVNDKNKHLGYFNSINDALSARKLAENEYGFHQNHGVSQ